MSAENLIAQASSGPALLSVREKAICDPTGIRAIAKRWRNAAGKVGTYTGTLHMVVKDVDDVWEGDSADAFTDYMKKYNRAGEELHDALMSCAGSLDALATALQEANSSVNTAYDNLVSRVTTHLEKHPKATSADIESAVNSTLTTAQGHLNAAGTAVGEASKALTKHLNDREILFRDIAAPHKDPFAPDPKRVFDWQRTALPESVRQQLADASSEGGGSGGTGPSGEGGGSGGVGPSGGPPGVNAPAAKPEVVEWIKEALTILRDNGVAVNPDDQATIDKIWTIIFHESGGNPEAINNWDSNADAGTPSKGLMQTIDPTFQAHKQSGYNDIWNPVHNIMAGVNYTISRYNSLDGHPGLESLNQNGGYKPY